jgi:transcriptional regulator with XRE-family HTH domain
MGDTTMSPSESDDCEEFGTTLYYLRRYAGLARSELATRAHVSRKTLVRLERGEVAPTEDVRARLEQAVGVPLYFGEHRKVPVRVGRLSGKIDEGIAPLIEQLWRAGIPTRGCSQQAMRGLVYIGFPHVDHLCRFVNVVASYKDESQEAEVYWRIIGAPMGNMLIPSWHFELGADGDTAVETAIAGPSTWQDPPPCQVRFPASVYLPPHDLPAILERLKRHNSVAADPDDDRRDRWAPETPAVRALSAIESAASPSMN